LSSASSSVITQYISSNFLSVELTDIIASLVGLAAVVVMLRFWKSPGRTGQALDRMADEREHEGRRCPGRRRCGRSGGDRRREARPHP
jgi:L-lactate permease